MAKYDFYQPPYEDINELNVKNTLERDIAYNKNTIAEIDERIANLEVRYRKAELDGNPRAGDIGRTILAQEEYKIRRQRQVDGATRDLRTVTERELPQQPDTGDISSGAVVDEESLARKEGAGTQTPLPEPLDTPSDEAIVDSNADQTTVTTPFVEEDPISETNLLDPTKTDDQGKVAPTVNRQLGEGVEYQQNFIKPFSPSLNPTTKYAQLTYNIGLYLATPEQYRRILGTKNKTTQGLQKILQSGGNHVSEQAIFPDLFIDDLELNGLMPEANGSPHNVLNMNFKIIEPMGYTFLRKLRKLCEDNGMQEFSKQHYIMVIKYKGFDENGKSVSDEMDDRLTKFIPFIFQQITSRVATGAITYDCRALALNHEAGLSAKRATIPFNVEVLGQTLNDLFNATSDATTKPGVSTSQTTAISSSLLGEQRFETTVTPGILTNSAGTPAMSKGIVSELNKQSEKLVKDGSYAVADKYKVTFKGGIGKHKVTASVQENHVKKRTPMSAPSAKNANAIANNTAVDKTRQTQSIPAGQQMNQLIDILVRSSEYITKQQKIKLDQNGKQVKGNVNAKFTQWFHIGVNATPLGWDNKRGDYAYEIEYIVSPRYQTTVHSPYFADGEFRGVQKSYSYWFTGENTEVLDYSQAINSTYYVAMDGKTEQPEQETGADKDLIKPKAFINSQTSGLGQEGNASSPAQQAADVLYSTIDFTTFEMTILGDPDYVMQSDVFYDSGDQFEPFLDDGSINYDSQEVLVGLKFRTMEDYDGVTGGAELLDPLFTDGTNDTQSLIYKLTHVNSYFGGGKMTQTLKGVLREFPKKTTDTGREQVTQQSTVTKKRKSNGNSVPGQRAVTDSLMVSPNFSPISVRGNQVPGDRAATSGSSIGPDFAPISVAQNGQGQFDTAGPLKGPDFTPISVAQNGQGQFDSEGNLIGPGL